MTGAATQRRCSPRALRQLAALLAEVVWIHHDEAPFALEWVLVVADCGSEAGAFERNTFIDVFAAELFQRAGEDPRALPLRNRLVVATGRATP